MTNEEWISKYRGNKDAIWIKCKLTDGRQFYHDDFNGWIDIKRICEEEQVFVKELKLSFRSHEVELDIEEDCEAVYLIKSVMGQMGSETKHYYTTGILRDNTVYKKMWLIPELVVDKELEDDVSECFKQAMIYNEQKKKDREE